jgi:hypothetical protein
MHENTAPSMPAMDLQHFVTVISNATIPQATASCLLLL